MIVNGANGGPHIETEVAQYVGEKKAMAKPGEMSAEDALQSDEDRRQAAMNILDESEATNSLTRKALKGALDALGPLKTADDRKRVIMSVCIYYHFEEILESLGKGEF